MEIHFHEVQPDWVGSLDLSNLDFMPAYPGIQCYVFQLDALKWRVFNFIAPKHHGLWFFRPYQEFETSMRLTFFSRNKEGGLDEDRRKIFDSTLRKLNVRQRSNHAAWCFGIYPRLWGDRYLPKDLNGRLAFRLLSVAAPIQFGQQVRAHFLKQTETFAGASLSSAPDDERLFVTSSTDSHPSARLLLKPILAMNREERRACIDRLTDLIDSDGAREIFVSGMASAIKFSGVIRSPLTMDVIAGAEEECAQIARLRVKLACRLGWPHMVEYLRLKIVERTDSQEFMDLLPELDEALSIYPVIAESPISA